MVRTTLGRTYSIPVRVVRGYYRTVRLVIRFKTGNSGLTVDSTNMNTTFYGTTLGKTDLGICVGAGSVTSHTCTRRLGGGTSTVLRGCAGVTSRAFSDILKELG